MDDPQNMSLLGRSFDNYDFLTLGALILMLGAGMAVIMFIMGLPGRIAKKRNHPHAEAVNIMGWMGFLAVVPWVHSFMWAFHDSMTVDVRRFPKEEHEAIRREMIRLGKSPAEIEAFDQESSAGSKAV